MVLLRTWALARRSRLLQFLAMGGALFALAPRGEERRVVEFEPQALAALRDAQAKKLGVKALPEEGTREVEARAIEDEILYREALRLGLDKGDPIVRQRLVQKLLLLVEDLGGASREPSTDELRAYFADTSERWRKPTRYRIVHVFATAPERVPADATLRGMTEAPAVGDPFPYPRAVTSSREEMGRVFGASFADGVAALGVGAISEILQSPFGFHRVRLVERVEGGRARFEEVTKAVLLDYLLDRRERVVGTYLKETVAMYDVRIGGQALRGFVPTRRVAARTEGSAED